MMSLGSVFICICSLMAVGTVATNIGMGPLHEGDESLQSLLHHFIFFKARVLAAVLGCMHARYLPAYTTFRESIIV